MVKFVIPLEAFRLPLANISHNGWFLTPFCDLNYFVVPSV